METNKFTGELKELVATGISGMPCDIDFIMKKLNDNPSFAITRFVDYSLSLVDSEQGIERIEYYLFNGSLIQRNYASLYFNRIGDWDIIKRAYEKGLIDEIQAFVR